MKRVEILAIGAYAMATAAILLSVYAVIVAYRGL